MSERVRKITVNVPVEVLDNAIRVTGKGVTLTVVEGLREIERRAKRSALRGLRGRIRFKLDLEETRR
jgi:transcriptional regulator of met regulon